MSKKYTKTDHKGLTEMFGKFADEMVDDTNPTINAKSDSKRPKSPKVKKVVKKDDMSSYNALELYNLKKINQPKLLDPFLQNIGLASLVGESDSGKSTFLRQLCLSIVLKDEKFLNYTINSKHNKVIYVSTEDNVENISFLLRKQIEILHPKIENDKLSLLENLEFIFETENLFKSLEKRLKDNPVDLIVLDAFTDIFTKEINSNTQVRTFLNKYDQLAKKNNCLILFLHHTGKRTQKREVTKDNVIGSQGFEAKMRVVLELRNNNSSNRKDLWVLKSNFLSKVYKNKSFTLDFSTNFIFTNTGLRGSKQSKAKSDNIEFKKKIISLHKEGHSSRKIEELLKDTDFKTSKSVASKIIKEYKEIGGD